MRQELYAIFASDVTPSFNVDSGKAAELGYATITQENIDAAIAKAVPLPNANGGFSGRHASHATNQQCEHGPNATRNEPTADDVSATDATATDDDATAATSGMKMIGGFGASSFVEPRLPPAQQQQPTMGYQQMPPQM